MSYTALARKYRPKTFSELIGQEHVRRALVNALTSGRVHHAFLFAGTRGVGKTTIARILAKCLNCETGVTAEPCGVCASCREIDAGRFPDLIEVDAASRTKVDDTRELLDNVQYAPARGRYKVYLIDEVHMLSAHSFNALLKTLEEPPPHVKFLLATTDPQKLPVTVLSRCLQFNLKQLAVQLIASRLAEIMRAEGIAFDENAAALIARVAHGSMRDALSVLDQAIAYGAGEVREAPVRAMLGAVDSDYCYRIADALLASDGPALLAEAKALAERSISMSSALDELASLFHRIAIAQTVPAALDSLPDAARIGGYTRAFTPEAVQLAYQICVQGREDLALAPDEQTGFAMTLLRLLAFEPGGGETKPAEPMRAQSTRSATAAVRSSVASAQSIPSAPINAAATAPRQAETAMPEISDWPAFVASMKLSGIALQLAGQTELRALNGNEFTLAVPEAARHLTDKAYADKLKAALEQTLGKRVRLVFEFVAESGETLSAQEKRERAARQAKTEAAFRDDPFVQDVLSRFDAHVKPDSIKPV